MITMFDAIGKTQQTYQRRGLKDAKMGRYQPPSHYGTQLSASFRSSYILAYLVAGGDATKLGTLDWFHVGIEAADFGMPREIKSRIERG